MHKEKLYLCYILFFCIIVTGCTNNHLSNELPVVTKVNPNISPSITQSDILSNTPIAQKFLVLYSGFLTIDENQIENYSMNDYYIITSRDDWDVWNSKYTANFPYGIEDFNMDWEHECLITYAYIGGHSSWNTMQSIKAVSISDSNVNITFSDQNPIYAFTNPGEAAIAIFVIKIDKPNNLSSLDNYLKYSINNSDD